MDIVFFSPATRKKLGKFFTRGMEHVDAHRDTERQRGTPHGQTDRSNHANKNTPPFAPLLVLHRERGNSFHGAFLHATCLTRWPPEQLLVQPSVSLPPKKTHSSSSSIITSNIKPVYADRYHRPAAFTTLHSYLVNHERGCYMYVSTPDFCQTTVRSPCWGL